jgi:hypothetical protein
MRYSQTSTSKYLKAADLPEGKFCPVTIDHVEFGNVAPEDKPAENKPIVHFVGKEKGLVLNNINGQTIADVYGDEMDDWAGKTIQLFRATTQYQGKNVPCIRVQVSKRTAAAPAAAPVQRRVVAAAAPAPVDDGYAGEATDVVADDDIPF